MSNHYPLLEISNEEAADLDKIFNPQYHGEVRVEFDEDKSRYIVNWYDTQLF
jgi:hypothetical protein